jgi:hypothetical protein
MARMLNPLIGTTIASYAAEHGPATDMVRLSESEGSFHWVLTGQGDGAIIPIGNNLIVAPPRKLVCVIILAATTPAKEPDLKDWTVQSWRWSGDC